MFNLAVCSSLSCTYAYHFKFAYYIVISNKYTSVTYTLSDFDQFCAKYKTLKF